jgi:hypothetical protein
MTMKTPMLACYDYGTGGVWVVIFARTGHEIEQKYPMLSVADSPPHWMTNELYKDLRSRATDIDDPPNERFQGMLKEWLSRNYKELR